MLFLLFEMLTRSFAIIIIKISIHVILAVLVAHVVYFQQVGVWIKVVVASSRKAINK